MDKKKPSLLATVLFFLAAGMNVISMVSNYRAGMDTGTVVLNGMAALLCAIAGILDLIKYFRIRNTKR